MTQSPPEKPPETVSLGDSVSNSSLKKRTQFTGTKYSVFKATKALNYPV